MSKIKNGGLDQYGALNTLNSSNLEQLALKGLKLGHELICPFSRQYTSVCSTLYLANVCQSLLCLNVQPVLSKKLRIQVQLSFLLYICYYSLWSVLPTPCCWATDRERH